MRILLIDDCIQDRAAFKSALSGHAYDVTECHDLAEAQIKLAGQTRTFDLLVVKHGQHDAAARRLMNGDECWPMLILGAPTADDDGKEPLFGHYLARSSAYLDALPQIVRLAAQRGKPQLADESPMRLQQIVDGSSVATFVIDQDHVVTHWNKACAVLTGTPAQQVVGTKEQWRAFYSAERPVMADLILDGALQKDVDRFYHGKFHPSALIEGAYEAKDFFPHFGDGGRWLYFTAAPLHDTDGRVIGAIETLQDVTDQHRAEEALRQSEERYRLLSITDGLTGLFNSRHFYAELKNEMARAERYERPLSLVMLDVDNFKRFNDSYGHLEGDRVLECLAGVIRNCLRREDSGYRLGGEEFAILVPETEVAQAALLAERLRATFADQCFTPIPGEKACSSVSIGVTQYRPQEGTSALIRRADEATYRAKHQGKNRVVVG